MQFLTGTATNGYSGLRLAINASSGWPFILGGGTITCIWTLQIPVLSTVTDQFTVICGLTRANNPNALDNGVYFQYTDTGSTPTWAIATLASNVSTTTQTNVTVVAGTWYTLRFDVNAAATSVSFYINGTATNVGPLTTHIPSVNIGPNISVQKNAGTTSRELDADMFYLYQKLTSSRS